MRNRCMMSIAALLLAARAAVAQPQPPQTQAPGAIRPPLGGTLDFGGLFTTTDGDEARYERYRDTRDGTYSNLSLNRESPSSVFDARAFHIGYRDQKYAASLFSRKVSFRFDWISLPLNYSYMARTPYVTNGTTLTLDDGAQRAVQGPTNSATDGTAVGVPCAPGAPPAACGNPSQAAQALANRSTYNSSATTFDLRHQRDTASFGLNYAATSTVDVDARFLSSGRQGQQPWGASFAFNDAVELPQPLDQRTNDLSLGASWTRPKAMVRVGWDGSWFNNHNKSLTWDNPIRMTDFNNGLTPPDGPYDPNGYSNGNGPVQGRQALAPDNMMNVVSATALYKLQGRTTINGTAQLTSQTQDETLIPFTINSMINSPTVLAAFPHLAHLPRPTAQAEARGVNA